MMSASPIEFQIIADDLICVDASEQQHHRRRRHLLYESQRQKAI